MTRIYKKWLPALCGFAMDQNLVRSFVPSENWQHLLAAQTADIRIYVPEFPMPRSSERKVAENFRTSKSPGTKISRTFSAMRKVGSQIELGKIMKSSKKPMDIMHGNFLKTLCVSLSFDCWWLLWVTTIHIIDTTCASKTSMFTHTFFTSRIQKLDIHSQKNRWPTCIYVLGSNSNYIHIIEDGHQPNSRGLYTYYKDFPLQVDDHHQYNMFWLWAGLYIPRTQMTLVLIGKGPVLGGLTFKNTVEVIGALGIYIYIHVL